MFIAIERRTLILKMVECEVFLMKQMHQNHLSQREECDYGAQSRKESRLLCESMFILFERWTSIQKMVEKQVFLMNPKHQNRFSQYEKWVYSAQPRKERRLLCESMFISIEIRTSILEIVEREIVLTKPKH